MHTSLSRVRTLLRGWLAVERVGVGTVLVVLAILFVTLYFRGLDFGRPFSIHPDEQWVIEPALGIATTGNFNPKFLEYPSLPIYVQAGVSAIKHLSMVSQGQFLNKDGEPFNKLIGNISTAERFEHYAAGRRIIALIAALTLVAVYFAARPLCGPFWALFAVAATMLSSMFVEQAHYVTPNIYMALFPTCALAFCLRFCDSKRLLHLYLAAVCVGLGIGSKYVPAVALALLVVTPLLYPRTKAWRHIPLFGLAAIGTFLITTPYALFDLPEFLKDVGNIFSVYKMTATIGSAHPEPSWLVYMRHMWGTAPYLLVFGILGLLILPFWKGRRGILPIIYPMLYFDLLAESKAVFTRNITPLVPFRAIGAAVSLAVLYAIVSGRNRTQSGYRPRREAAAIILCSALAVLILWSPSARSISVVRELTSERTFQTAQSWIERNLPPQSRIASDRFSTCPVIPLPDQNYRVSVIPGPFFSLPYMSYLNNQFVVSSCVGAYDAYPWLREVAVQNLLTAMNPRDPEFAQSYLAANRRLDESRLCPIQRFESTIDTITEMIDGSVVCVYSMPRPSVVALDSPPANDETNNLQTKTSEAEGDGGLMTTPDKTEIDHTQATSKKNDFDLTVTLQPGEYDIFIQAEQIKDDNGNFPGSAPSVTMQLGPFRQLLPCMFFGIQDYFAGTYATASKQDLPLHVTPGPRCHILKVFIVRVGNPPPGLEFGANTSLVGYSENKLANGGFESGTRLWVSPDTSKSVEVSVSGDQAPVGLSSLRVSLDNSYNLGISQKVDNVKPGDEYVLSGMFKTENVVGTASLEVQDGDTGYKTFAKSTRGITGTKPWTGLTMRFRVPQNVKSLNVFVRRPNIDNAPAGRGTVWVDACKLFRLLPATTP